MLDIERTSSLIWRFEADGTAQTFGLYGRHLYLKDFAGLAILWEDWDLTKKIEISN